MTEAAHQMASNPLPPGERRPGTVGRRDRRRDRDPRRRLAAAAVGRASARSACAARAWSTATATTPRRTPPSFRDGWFRTGDSGSLDADGYLHLAGRIKELINRGGEKISPHEVEEALLAAPGGAPRRSPSSLPDAKYGETVGAVVVLGRRRRRGRAAARTAPSSSPASRCRRGSCSMDAIPKGPTGKIQRRTLAEQIGAAMRIAVLGAGAIGAYVGAALAPRRRRRAPRRARRAPGGDPASTACACCQPARRLHGAPAGDRRPGRDRAGRRRLPRPEGVPVRRGAARCSSRCSARRPPSSRRRTGCRGGTSTASAGRTRAAASRRSIPGGATSAVDRARARDRLRRLLRDRARGAGRDPAHRGHAVLDRRARRHDLRALLRVQRGDGRRRAEVPGRAGHPRTTSG